MGAVDPCVALAAGRSLFRVADLLELARQIGGWKSQRVEGVELMLSRALAANDAGLMACHDRNSFHPEEFGRGGLAPGQSLDSAKRTQQVTVFSMNQI